MIIVSPSLQKRRWFEFWKPNYTDAEIKAHELIIRHQQKLVTQLMCEGQKALEADGKAAMEMAMDKKKKELEDELIAEAASCGPEVLRLVENDRKARQELI